MRDINRIRPLLEQIESIWKKYPDLRLTQLLNWVIKSDKDISNRDSFYVEDHELMKALKKLNNIENRTGDE